MAEAAPNINETSAASAFNNQALVFDELYSSDTILHSGI